MEHAKFANGNRHLSSTRHAPERAEKDQKDAARPSGQTPLRKKTEPANTGPRQLQRKDTGRKRKVEKLVCRYCGSDDLAPSFIKRRDRRCRKCFSRRYGSAARAKKAKPEK